MMVDEPLLDENINVKASRKAESQINQLAQ